jgi:hypothetical protein
VRVLVGKNPRAMAINQADTRGYVWNYVSRDVTVVNLGTNTVVGTVAAAAQPGDTTGQTVQRGKELFNTSIGPLCTAGGQPQGVMADHGWCACASCHPNGLTDGVAWMFPAGPRIATPLNATFSKTDGHQRALNWSAIFDEVADFEGNTRNVAGGLGLIQSTPCVRDPNVNAFTVPSAGRSADRDAITAYFKTIRTPISPVPAGDSMAANGRAVFEAAGCATCHGGSLWTKSVLQFTPPPPSNALVTEQGTAQLVGQLTQVGTFNAAKRHELIGTGANISKQALGQLGYNPPSLLGIHALGPYLHDGSLETLDQVLDNPTHVGTSSLLRNVKVRAALVRFLQSIDESTTPF